MTSGWRSNPYPAARRWTNDTILDAALLAGAVLPSLAVEALLHLLRKDDTVRWHALTCSVSSIESQNGLPDFSFMSVPGPERVVSHRLYQDRRYVGLQTISLLNIESQNHGVVLCFADAFNQIVDDVRVDAGDRSPEAMTLVAHQLAAHGRAWRRPDGRRHQADVGNCTFETEACRHRRPLT